MSDLIDTLYPRRCPGTGNTCLLCPDQTTLLACLPPQAAHDEDALHRALVAALAAHVAVPMAALIGGHFPLWRHPDPVESAVLLLPEPDPDTPDLCWCAGGPTGLLELRATAEHLRELAEAEVRQWRDLVAGTPPADAWWRYAGRHRGDPHRYPLPECVAQFTAQPRIAAMHEAPDADFAGDLFGPGLEALHAGGDAYAQYQAGVYTFGDGLVSLDGDLLVPSHSRLLVEQSLAERRLYHHRAQRYLENLDPTTVLAAVRCIR